MERELLLTGVGGQGVQLASQVLARAALAERREVMVLGTYGGTMRGGSTDSCIVVADEPIRTPPIVSRAWAAIAMHDRFFAPTAVKLHSDSVAFINASLFESSIEVDGVRVFEVEATRVAAELGSPMSASLVLAAAFAGATGFVSCESLVAAMRECVPSYRKQHVEANERALLGGFGLLQAGEVEAWSAEVAA
ncbi:MAG: 2-oxoacid:acceptor oxidoreductase family protein [Myxococcota bacterium]|nr:2-oxoacid:acceptor oxidoreductase family protein [Myxococcota bacterium]